MLQGNEGEREAACEVRRGVRNGGRGETGLQTTMRGRGPSTQVKRVSIFAAVMWKWKG
jgi:hypothetical protein